MFTIQDCFATNAKYLAYVTYRIKIAFLAIYADKDYLNTFKDNIINYFKNIGISVSDDNRYFTVSGKNQERVSR